jgi:hypothetical protein
MQFYDLEFIMEGRQMANKRSKQFIDRSVQGAILLRLVTYWVLFLFVGAMLLLFIEVISGDPKTAWRTILHRHAPTLLAALALTPMFIHDLCKFTNRFAGPMVRLRREMANLAEGREVSPLHFRDGDFWQDLATDFNRVVARVQASPPAETLALAEAADGDPEEDAEHESLDLVRT